MRCEPKFLGIDFGTSGCRGVIIDRQGHIIARDVVPMAAPIRSGDSARQDPGIWWTALEALLHRLQKERALGDLWGLCVDGTSGTFTVTSAEGTPLIDALMYDDATALEEAEQVAAVAPPTSAALGASSPLAKLMRLIKDRPDLATGGRVLHQADWISNRLLGTIGVSDESNSLKMGYDPVARAWPRWIRELGVPEDCLPKVVGCGSIIGNVDGRWRFLGLSPQTRIVAGATDGVAAFLATGAAATGDGVTVLGSTLVIKQLSPAPIFAAKHGIYSHRLGDAWLAGGASNTGGAALARYIAADEIDDLCADIDPSQPSVLDYYPLRARGERFPIADPHLESRVAPIPANRSEFLHGLLEGIARVERDAYLRLRELGAPALHSIRTVGGGARNGCWTKIRERVIGVPMLAATSDETAYGTALLCRRACVES